MDCTDVRMSALDCSGMLAAVSHPLPSSATLLGQGDRH